MKKIISIVLCISLLVGIFALTASAESELPIKGEITDYPVIIVPGYSAAWLMLGDDPETAECAWSGLDLNLLLPKLLDRIAELGLGLAVMNLDKKYRTPILLFYYEGYSTAEISSILGITEKTKVIFAKDTDTRKDWYFAVSSIFENGITVRPKKNGGMCK